MPVRQPSGAAEQMVGHRNLELRERPLPEKRSRQIQHLDGLKAIKLGKVPTRVCDLERRQAQTLSPGTWQ